MNERPDIIGNFRQHLLLALYDDWAPGTRISISYTQLEDQNVANAGRSLLIKIFLSVCLPLCRAPHWHPAAPGELEEALCPLWARKLLLSPNCTCTFWGTDKVHNSFGLQHKQTTIRFVYRKTLNPAYTGGKWWHLSSEQHLFCG